MTRKLSREQRIAGLVLVWRNRLLIHRDDRTGHCRMCRVPLRECQDRKDATSSLQMHGAMDDHGNILPLGAALRPPPRTGNAGHAIEDDA